MDNRLTALLSGGRSLNVTGLRASAPAMFIAEAVHLSQRTACCLVPDETAAQHLAQDLALFAREPVVCFPGQEIPPYTPLSPDGRTVSERLAALYQIHGAEAPFILVMSIEASLRLVMPRNFLSRLAELVMRGEETDLETLVGTLAACGYETASLVQSVGEFSLRGGILDIFPAGFEMPVRLDFCGDTVESIRSFDPISQRSVEELEEIIVLPVSEVLFPLDQEGLTALLARFRDRATQCAWDRGRTGAVEECLRSRRRFPGIEFLSPLFSPELSTIFAYLPEKTILFPLAPLANHENLTLCRERIAANFAEASKNQLPALPPCELFIEEGQWQSLMRGLQQVRFYDFAHPDMGQGETLEIVCGNHELLRQQLELQKKSKGVLPELAESLRHWLKEGDSLFLACRTRRHADHLAEFLRQHNLPVAVSDPPISAFFMEQKEILLLASPLSAGFDLPGRRQRWLSESELFGGLRMGPGRKKAGLRNRPAANFAELKAGEIVVHAAHGLARYDGLVNLELDGIVNEFFKLIYRDDDRLYVPVDQLKVISPYQGISDTEPKLDKLGSKAWASRREKVKEEVWKVAQELLDIYARRAMAEGHSFSPPDEFFNELEESFPYDETPGQLKAINEVLDDLSASKPMDRLICGDVGYGKTEVAIRAAFKVAEDNFQVAILVPTTVLAEQHAATFRERLQGFPLRVESLTRFRGPAEQKQLVKDLAEGRVDIIVGTHRLLSQDVVFKRLGLLIVDEEHRFGVSHKEKLKKLKSRVDVLTLTATPIPRTLQLSLLGIRDLSVISSPPELRRPVKTFVSRDDDLVIREAVLRELQRGGQVFLVHNRVHSIQAIAARVQRLVPEARLAVAHGQMPGKALEEVMVRFVRRDVDVLICTTIIESGLDIPNANTIVITRADRLGLAEIYQLRGRVGRGREQAYAYLLVPSLDGMSKDAQQRIRALMDYNELGGGFKLAMSDLQIRGGGNILGISQSGNIAAVGYDLYLELLQQTVLDLKHRGGAEPAAESIEPEINLKISAFLPASYIPSTGQRYVAYRRLTCAEKVEELMDLREEFVDRYGSLPREAINLFSLLALKTMLKKLLINRLEQGAANLVFTFHEKTPVTPETIMSLLEKFGKKSRFTPESRLIVEIGPSVAPEQVIKRAQNILALLAKDDIYNGLC